MTTVHSTTTGDGTTGPARHAGRPRDPEMDARILGAAVELLELHGLAGVTVSGVAQRIGVSRATIYLRWHSAEAFLGAVVRAAAGGDPYPLTGDIATDLRAGTEFAHRVVAGPHFIPALPELFAAVLADPPQVDFDDIAPNRQRFAALYAQQAAAQGFDPSLDPHLALDVLLGAQLVAILAEKRPPTTRYVQDLAELLVRGLRPRSPRA
ncbi:MAG TPA: helix-turn-helix domain-containing protein [Candidatus Limnocylindrales bacterium]|nr:helix-turn-helix domain-containing protein [Candidatus Limnocylindrales bacterium]